MKAKWIIALACLVLMLIVPLTAGAVTYDISSGDVVISSDGDYTITGITTEYNVSVSKDVSANISLKDASIVFEDSKDKCAFDIATGADVKLTLVGANTLKSGMTNAGIHVPPDAKLTVKGSGNLNVTGGTSGNDGGAGIGGDYSAISFGTIIIETTAVQSEPNITAIGGSHAAGIGGGGDENKQGKSDVNGKVIVNSGKIKATGGAFAAGIGGGADSNNKTEVEINGGTVEAVGQFGAGIGGGYGGSGGTIKISKSDVTASGTRADSGRKIGSAGIGGSGGGDGGNISIENSTVRATGDYGGAGIGGSFSEHNCNVYGSGGTIYINKSNVTARSGDGYLTGAGIGGGYGGGGGSIAIIDSIVEAYAATAVGVLAPALAADGTTRAALSKL